MTWPFWIIIGLFAAPLYLNLVELTKIRRNMSQTNQGLTDLTAAVAADTAEVQNEAAAFTALETAITNLVAAGPGSVTSAQLETLAQTLTAAQTARAAQDQAALAAATVASTPAPTT